MTAIRMSWRGLLIILHILLGLFLARIYVRKKPENGAYYCKPELVSWWHRRFCDILNLKVTVSGPTPQAPSLMISNHVSWLDIIVLGGQSHTTFLSKDDVRSWPVVGWLSAVTGTLFIKRGGGESQSVNAQIAERLSKGGLLTLFPEGTTTDGTDVRAFFSRLFAAALDSNTSITPVTVRYHIGGNTDLVAPYIGDQTLLDNMLGLIKRPKNEVQVIFAEPISVEGMSRKEASQATRDIIVEQLQSATKNSSN